MARAWRNRSRPNLLLLVAGAGLLTEPAAAIDRHVRIMNESSHDIVAFHASYLGGDDGRGNLLGDAVLRPGGSIVLDLHDGSGYCRFGFRAVFADGVELRRNRVNICDIGTFRYTD